MADNLPLVGAARRYLASKFGGLFAELESVATVGVAAATLVGNNPDRLALLVIGLGANNVFLGLQQNVSASRGIQLAPNGGSVAMIVDEDFTLPTRELFAIAPGGNTAVYVLELVRNVALLAAEGG